MSTRRLYYETPLMYTYWYSISPNGQQERCRLLTEIREEFPSANVSPWSSPRLRLYTEWTAYILTMPIYFQRLFKQIREFSEEPLTPAEQYIVLQDDAFELFEKECHAQPTIYKFFPDDRLEFVTVNRWVLSKLRESDESLKEELKEYWDRYEEILEYWKEGAPIEEEVVD